MDTAHKPSDFNGKGRPKMKIILGTKIGMTQIIGEDGVVTPVTILQAGPCTVTQTKSVETDGYSAVQLAFGQGKNLSKAVSGHVKKAGKDINPKYIREFRVEEIPADLSLGSELTVSEFALGDKVQVTGTSKGKGTAGVIKRWNFHRLKETHGTGPCVRHGGSIGACSSPSRVWKGKKMAGHLGAEQVTVQNLTVVKVDVENNLIAVKGAVPGPNKGIVILKDSVKA